MKATPGRLSWAGYRPQFHKEASQRQFEPFRDVPAVAQGARKGAQGMEARLRSRCVSCTSSAVVDGALAERPKRLVFFGGKGGVGKTSSSAAYAAMLAEQGLKTLIISTDPAHSLGDALTEDLSGSPREIADNLWAVEVDPTEGLRELRSGLKSLDAKEYLDSLGLPGGTTAALGLEELSELLDKPPPGLDEVTAIAQVAASSEGYDVVVFDTAPTGHTLRMLEVPQFIGKFLDRALVVRKSVGSVLGMFGLGASMDKVDVALETAEDKVQRIRERISWLETALKTPPGSSTGTSAEFIVVSRPTALDTAEAERLVLDLRRQGVHCGELVVNQILDAKSSATYWSARVNGQQKVIKEMKDVCKARNLPLVEVADISESLVGVPALSYLASLAYREAQLPETEVLLFGGKGGVGKTSMSSSLAVQFANEGQRVLVISTDPAHSLGDAFGVPLSEEATQLDTMGTGELFAMEVDTAAAMQRFQTTVREALQRRESSDGIVGQVLKQLPMNDFVDLFDTLPPGSDEIVSLAGILNTVKDDKFDKIIIDTAPTGHALRLLSFPDFLGRFVDRVMRLRDRFGWLAGSSGGKDPLRSFEFRMIELQDLFADPERTSFVVVTIPTALALAESKRLLGELEEQDIKAGMVIVNRVIDPERAEEAFARKLATQDVSMKTLEQLAKREHMTLKEIAYCDTEVRGIYGLKYIGSKLIDHAA